MPEINLAGQSLKFSAYRTFSTEAATALGVKKYEIGENSANIFKYGSDVRRFINSVAKDRKTGPTVNVFWLKNNNEKETLFVQIPFNQEDKASSATVVLQTDFRTREIITQLLTNPDTTQEALKEYLIDLLKPSGTKIDPEKINSTTLAYLSSSSNKLVLTATQRGAIPFSDKLAEPFRSLINIESLLHREEEPEQVPASTPLMPTAVKKTKHISPFVAKEKRAITEVVTDDESELKKIDGTVSKRAIKGNLVGKVTIHGQQLSSSDHNPNNSDDYHVLPEESETFVKNFDPTNRMDGFHEACLKDAYGGQINRPEDRITPEGFNFFESLSITYIRNPDDNNLTRLMINVPVTDRDCQFRPALFCSLYCEIPTSQFDELIKLIRKNPENAERFIQIAFAGLDDATGRVPVKKVSVIDVNEYIPLEITKILDLRSFPDYRMKEAKDKRLLNTDGISTYNFSQLYP